MAFIIFASIVQRSVRHAFGKPGRSRTEHETEAEAVAPVVGKAVGLVTGGASADYVVFAVM
jgi:hypothetical protein